MSVDKELLEKYHLGTCSFEEKKQVEEWLFDTQVEDLDLPLQESETHKKDIWAQLQNILPNDQQNDRGKSHTYFMWKGAIAASLFIAVFATISYYIYIKNNEPSSTALINSSGIDVKYLKSEEYDVTIGTNTIARINNLNGVIDLSGSILISPKEDISLFFKGTEKKVVLKKGQTYIILNSDGGANRIIVISERNLLDLPPVMQKQITTQFGI